MIAKATSASFRDLFRNTGSETSPQLYRSRNSGAGTGVEGWERKGGRGEFTTCILSNFEHKPKPEKHFTSGCTPSKIRSKPRKRKHKPQDTQVPQSRRTEATGELLQINIYNTSVTVLKVSHFLCSYHPNILLNLMKSVKVLVVQSCLTLCDPMDCSPPGSFVHGILQTRTLEGVAIPFSRGSSRDRTPVCLQCR